MTGLRAITVCVGYEDLLAVTLPYNRHHFDEVHIVTDHASVFSVLDIMKKCSGRENVWYHATDLFYADGATFNKWRALEWGLDRMGRHGWLCVMDADVLWPKDVKVEPGLGNAGFLHISGYGPALCCGELFSPLRRMAPWPMPMTFEPSAGDEINYLKVGEPFTERLVGPIPSEGTWVRYPIHRNIGEWAGYTQIFHAEDPHLPPPPWHDVGWKHAGGADSFFQGLWPMSAKRRPSWEVLHLGEAGANWFGRHHPQAKQLTSELWRRRAERRRAGQDPFAPEKLG